MFMRIDYNSQYLTKGWVLIMLRSLRAWLACTIIVTISLFQSVYADPPLPTPVGRVVWIKGTLKAVQPNKEERTLVKMSVIYLHDTLETSDNSQAEIVFTDNTLMTFYPNSKVAIDQYAYKLKAVNGSAGKQVTNLIEGGFRTITGVIAKTNNSDYTVNTPVATIGVRGTDYAVRLQDGHLYAAWYAGKPCLTSKPEETGAGNNQNSNQNSNQNNEKKPAAKELCLDSKTQFAEVPGAGQPPIPLQQMPDALKEKLNVQASKISPFGAQGMRAKGGIITSFCITR